MLLSVISFLRIYELSLTTQVSHTDAYTQKAFGEENDNAIKITFINSANFPTSEDGSFNQLRLSNSFVASSTEESPQVAFFDSKFPRRKVLRLRQEFNGKFVRAIGKTKKKPEFKLF